MDFPSSPDTTRYWQSSSGIPRTTEFIRPLSRLSWYSLSTNSFFCCARYARIFSSSNGIIFALIRSKRRRYISSTASDNAKCSMTSGSMAARKEGLSNDGGTELMAPEFSGWYSSERSMSNLPSLFIVLPIKPSTRPPTITKSSMDTMAERDVISIRPRLLRIPASARLRGEIGISRRLSFLL